VLLALASGIGEEVLFRGWLQAEVGLVAASLLFGAAHVWGRETWPYGLYAAGMGGVLGGLLMVTGSLWAPVLAHALNNLLGFLALRDGWLALPSEQGSEGGDG
jgi:membrane protease YdiL (CAAX protease family)